MCMAGCGAGKTLTMALLVAMLDASKIALKGCQWVSRRVNRCVASGKGVETGGSLYLDMEVAKGSEVAGTTVTDTPL